MGERSVDNSIPALDSEATLLFQMIPIKFVPLLFNLILFFISSYII